MPTIDALAKTLIRGGIGKTDANTLIAAAKAQPDGTAQLKALLDEPQFKDPFTAAGRAALEAFLGGAPAPTPSPSSGSVDWSTDKSSPTRAQLLSMIDGARTRVLLKLSSVDDTELTQHLVAAAKRGVDVQVYLPMAKPGGGRTVLNAEGLEASGVDIMVDRHDALPAMTVVADDATLAPDKSGKLQPTADSKVVKAASDAFESTVAEPAPRSSDALKSGQVKLFTMPDTTGSHIVSAINRAKTSIDLEVYQLEDPAVVTALEAAAKRGVKVRVMLEPKTVGAANYDMMSKRLAAAGIDVQPTPPDFDGHHNVDHAKFMVLDGTELLYGTGNLVRSGLGGNHATEFDNRDFWVADARKGPASDAAKLFQADWDRTPTSSLDLSDLVVTPDNADAKVLQLIGASKQRCYVYNQSLDDPQVVQALIEAKQRGVDVRVLLGYQPGFGGAAPKNQAALDALGKAGIPAAFYERNYLHAKGVVSDGAAFLGSQNFTAGGLAHNREFGEVLTDSTLVDQVAQLFLDDQQHNLPKGDDGQLHIRG